jgi:hypothetical protein
MKIINNENRDEIMFALLEGEIVGDERIKLIEQISANPELAEEMAYWKKTIYNLEDDKQPVFLNSIKRKKTIITWQLISGIAASILLFVWIGISFYTSKQVAQPVQIKTKEAKNVVQNPDNPEKGLPVSPNHIPTNEDSKDIDQLEPHHLHKRMVTNITKDTLAPQNRLVTNDSTGFPAQKESLSQEQLIAIQDSVVLSNLRNIVSNNKDNPRKRGMEIEVEVETISDSSSERIKESKLKQAIANYRLAGFKRKYDIVKEPCDNSEFMCYSLVITEGDKKTYIKL